MTTIDRLTAALADRYRIERELGAGGMATVYLAHDLKHDREVAIKVLREDLSASLGAGRFLREIKIAAQLQHPHILPLLDSGEADGFLFFVMPYIKGQSLRERIDREGELPVHEAVRLLTEVVDALVEAHEHGVVHRDIKPDNVMLSGRHALVTDFGVAKAISEATGRNTVTTLGVAVGTPTYMSPEQAAADPHVDHRSDIYSVGVMAYEMLSGRPPFTGSTPQQVLAAHVTEAPDSVAKRRPAIPAALEAVVMRCLAKRPADRFQTAAELHAALEPLATPSMGVTPTHTAPVRPVVSLRRGPLAVAVVAAALLLAGGGWLVFGKQVRTPVPRAIPPAIQVTNSGEAIDAAISPDGSRIAYTVKHCDATGRCLVDLLVEDVQGAGTLTVSSGANQVDRVSWSPDGRYILIAASRDGEHGTYLVPSSVQGASRRFPGGDVEFVATADTVLITPVSPVTDSVVWLKIARTSDAIAVDSIAVRHPSGFLAATASRDGRWIGLFETSADNRTHVRIIGRNGDEVDQWDIDNVTDAEFDDAGLHWTRTTNSGSATYELVHQPFNWKTGHRRGSANTVLSGFTLFTAGLYVGAFSVTPDLRTLAYAQGTPLNEINAFRRPDLGSGRFDVHAVSKSTSPVQGAISPDGRSILIWHDQLTGTERTKVQLALVPFEGGPEMTFASLADSIAELEWLESPAPAVLYGVMGADKRDHLSVYEVRTRQTRALFTLPHDGFRNMVPIDSGRFLAYHFGDSVASVIMADGTTERRFNLPREITVSSLVAAPGRAEVALYGSTIANDSVEFFVLRIADGAVSRIAAFPARNGKVTGWRTNRELLASIRETIETAALYDVFLDGRPPRRIGVLPSGIGYSSATDGLRFATMSIEPRSDIWLMRDVGQLFRP